MCREFFLAVCLFLALFCLGFGICLFSLEYIYLTRVPCVCEEYVSFVHMYSRVETRVYEKIFVCMKSNFALEMCMK